MTAPNTGAPTANAPNNSNGEAGRPLTDAERATRPAHAGGYTVADRVGKLEKEYEARFESTHSLDRSSFAVSIVTREGTRIAATGATLADAVTALESRLSRIGEALKNA